MPGAAGMGGLKEKFSVFGFPFSVEDSIYLELWKFLEGEFYRKIKDGRKCSFFLQSAIIFYKLFF